MFPDNSSSPRLPAAVSDSVLRNIADLGFFASTGSLADARAACAELIFARSLIAAQTAKLNQLERPVRCIGSA